MVSPLAMCFRKASYASKGEALANLPRKQYAATKSSRMQVYRCPLCFGFHVGHRRGRKGRG